VSNYNTESVDAIYLEHASYAELKAAGPGAFTYTYEDSGGKGGAQGMDARSIEAHGLERGRVIGMIHVLPGAGFGHLNIRPYAGSAASWEWDGNVEKPTLSPSVHALPAEPKGDYPGRIGWHGWLRNGRWVSC